MVQYIRYTSEYIPMLQIHQHSLLTRKVFSRHNLSTRLFFYVSSRSSSSHLHLQVIFIVKSSSLSSHLHQVWIITGSSSSLYHHLIWSITGSSSSLDHHLIWSITGSSLDLDHHQVWIVTGSIRGNLGSKMGLIRKRAKISFCELEFKNK